MVWVAQNVQRNAGKKCLSHYVSWLLANVEWWTSKLKILGVRWAIDMNGRKQALGDGHKTCWLLKRCIQQYEIDFLFRFRHIIIEKSETIAAIFRFSVSRFYSNRLIRLDCFE